MKKILVLSLVLSLMLVVTGSVSAAVHNFTNDFENPFLAGDFSEYNRPFEGWYYIGEKAPSATARGYFPEKGNAFGFEYFQNDQTFANLFLYDSETGLKGSYLFKNNVFVGLDYFNSDFVSQTTLSPGYRFNFAKNGYVAGSLDYAVNVDNKYEDTNDDTGIVAYEFNGRYYTKESRAFGQIIIPNKDVAGSDDLYLYVGGAYKVSENVVVGGSLTNWRTTTFDIGCTTNFDKIGAEFRYTDKDGSSTIDLNGLYSFTNQIRAGLQVKKEENVDDLYLIAKCKYSINNRNSVALIHQLKNDYADAVTFLRWDIAL